MTTKILIVEDDPAIRDAIAYNLQHEGHQTFVAADGTVGLHMAREHMPDLVVLDLMLPGMSGLDVCRILRAEGPMLILMLTARDSEIDRVVGLEVGADDYMTKPFSMRELIARIYGLLRRDSLSRSAADFGQDRKAAQSLSAGRIELDTMSHEVRVDGTPIPVRPKEFELLGYLMSHPHQVLTRQAILDAVWGHDYDGQSRTVDVHVRWLREKVERDPSQPECIVTVRRVGYKLIP